MKTLLQYLWTSRMQYTTISYFFLVAFSLLFYYIFPRKHRWIVLIPANTAFLYLVNEHGKKRMLVFLCAVILSYSFGRIIEKLRTKRFSGGVLLLGIIASALPLFAVRWNELAMRTVLHRNMMSLIVPIGLSFYSLQLIAYLVDIYKGKIKAQTNLFRFYVFSSFFPQIIQGPIPRYEQLEADLEKEHTFDSDEFVKGFMLIIWGFFLKYMIADKAGVFVDNVFDNYNLYSGAYILTAGILYSFQLYADFMSCTTISQGVAELFGIHLPDNFNHPYFSDSIRDFWRRWHMSFSFWLRDYIYIPLGGNRKGILRKYLNVIITFAVSGLWHGGSYKFIAWGLLHAFYQVYETATDKFRNKLYVAFNMPKSSKFRKVFRSVWTFIWVMFGWIIFRADSLMHGLSMIKRIFVSFDPWTFTGDRLMGLGLDWKDWMVLILSLIILLYVSIKQEKMNIRDRILKMRLLVRWAIYITAIVVVMVYGSYGMGFEAKDFIYGGF